MARRSKLFERIEGAFKRSFYEDVDDATTRARFKRDLDGLVERAKSPELPLGEATSAVKDVLKQLRNQKPSAPVSK